MTEISLSQRIQARDGAAWVIYTKPNCQPCRMTKRKLDAAGIFYTEVDVTQDETALAYIKDTLGYTGAPVVYVSTIDGDHHWYGLRKDLLDHFIAYAEAA
ncbi:thioredoxin domain [Arthrobacter phage Sarge]|uniref:NrdH-like glutaredoxin n=1 Tax=Arthrobacter phage Sarge TaxID=2885974 RepID=A0AAE9C2I5_9CAUD|nr:thioredoxin domain [Arthrobacter phage Sarge]UDL14898.1 NrdH-like glutaredoxin [Arthrobacter phage Sarge]